MREKRRLELLSIQSMDNAFDIGRKKKKRFEFSAATRGSFGEKLMQAGVAVPPRIYLALVGIIAAWIAYLLSLFGALISGFAFFAFLYYMLSDYLREKALKRKAKMLPHLPAFIDSLASALSTGFNLEGAIVQATTSVPDGVLRSELDRVVLSLNRGLTLNESLLVLRQRLSGREVVSLICALNLFSTMGGRLLEPFRRLAVKVREQQQVAERATRDLTQVKQAFFIILLLSVGCPALLIAIEPTYLNAILRDSVGKILFQIAVMLQLISVFVFKKMTTIET